MKHEQTCKAVCGGGARVKGIIRCVSGRLFDVSHCVSQSLVSTNVSKVIGEMEMKVTGEPKVSFFIKALAATFNISETRIEVFIKTAAAAAQGRRLRQGLSNRRLSANVLVHYEVIVPPNASENAIASQAKALSQANSTAAVSFTASMTKSGLQVSEVAHILTPLVVQSVAVVDEDGALVNDRNPPSPDVPAKEPKNSSINVGLIIALVLGGLVILLALGCVVRLVLLRRKAEC